MKPMTAQEINRKQPCHLVLWVSLHAAPGKSSHLLLWRRTSPLAATKKDSCHLLLRQKCHHWVYYNKITIIVGKSRITCSTGQRAFTCCYGLSLGKAGQRLLDLSDQLKKENLISHHCEIVISPDRFAAALPRSCDIAAHQLQHSSKCPGWSIENFGWLADIRTVNGHAV